MLGASQALYLTSEVPIASGWNLTSGTSSFSFLLLLIDLRGPAGHFPGVSDPRVHPSASAPGDGDGDHCAASVQQDHVHPSIERKSAVTCF